MGGMHGAFHYAAVHVWPRLDQVVTGAHRDYKINVYAGGM